MAIGGYDSKIAKRFTLLDKAGSGLISLANFEDLIDELGRVYGPNGDLSAAVSLRERYVAFWHGVTQAAGQDPGGSLTSAQWVAAIRTLLRENTGNFIRLVQPAAEALLELADTDKSGRLSLPEYTRLMGVFGVEPAEVEEFFAQMDTDGSGDLSVEEIIEADRQFYLTDDGLPGDLFVGRH